MSDMDTDGRVWTSELSALTLEEEIRYDAVIGGLIGLGAGGPDAVAAGAEAGAVALSQYVVGLTPGEVNELVHSLPLGHSAIVALFEHTWATRLNEAALEAGGVILAEWIVDGAPTTVDAVPFLVERFTGDRPAAGRAASIMALADLSDRGPSRPDQQFAG